jgi:hypothetical protein
MGPLETGQDIEAKKRVAELQSKKPLNRAELRRRERVNSEVKEALSLISQKFLTFFMESDDPESQEVVDKMNQIDAKWRVFCKSKSLIPRAYTLAKEEMEGIIQEYLKEKGTWKKSTEQPQPIE